MSGIKNMHLRTRHVFAISLSASNDKRRIITSPKHQHARLMITKPFLPNRISLQIVLIIKEQIRLDVRLARLVQKVKLVRPGVGINPLRMWRRAQVSVARCVEREKTFAERSLMRRTIVPV